MTTPDYAEVLRLYRKHSRDQKEPLYQAFIHACNRIEALEAALRDILGAHDLYETECIARAALAPEENK